MHESEGAAPSVFRILLPARDLDEARRFYERLLGVRCRDVAPGRLYLDAGPVVLGLLDYSSIPLAERPRPVEAVYLACEDLQPVFARAKELDCLAKGLIHDDPTQPFGAIVRRPWGERSFYVDDPTGNPLCFVDARTKFTGTPDQVAALQHADDDGSPSDP
jgi:catechol 2,3-dioxygenase-like lactoylglutathione lyase family enzyme